MAMQQQRAQQDAVAAQDQGGEMATTGTPLEVLMVRLAGRGGRRKSAHYWLAEHSMAQHAPPTDVLHVPFTAAASTQHSHVEA
jgi:hypothetical protein